MGERYILKVTCVCGYIDDDVYYAPTSGFLTWKCPDCGEIIDLEEYSGIDAIGTARNKYGVKAIEEARNGTRS